MKIEGIEGGASIDIAVVGKMNFTKKLGLGSSTCISVVGGCLHVAQLKSYWEATEAKFPNGSHLDSINKDKM